MKVKEVTRHSIARAGTASPEPVEGRVAPGFRGRGFLGILFVGIPLETQNETKVNSYHRFWSFLMSGGLIIGGIVLLFIV